MIATKQRMSDKSAICICNRLTANSKMIYLQNNEMSIMVVWVHVWHTMYSNSWLPTKYSTWYMRCDAYFQCIRWHRHWHLFVYNGFLLATNSIRFEFIFFAFISFWCSVLVATANLLARIFITVAKSAFLPGSSTFVLQTINRKCNFSQNQSGVNYLILCFELFDSNNNMTLKCNYCSEYNVVILLELLVCNRFYCHFSTRKWHIFMALLNPNIC